MKPTKLVLPMVLATFMLEGTAAMAATAPKLPALPSLFEPANCAPSINYASHQTFYTAGAISLVVESPKGSNQYVWASNYNPNELVADAMQQLTSSCKQLGQYDCTINNKIKSGGLVPQPGGRISQGFQVDGDCGVLLTGKFKDQAAAFVKKPIK